MPVRKATLEEWFLIHHLRIVKKHAFHLPVELNTDISRIESIYRQRGERVPYTAILVKACALLAKSLPEVNRMVFSTFYGIRVVDFESINVNVPVLMDTGRSRLHLNFVTIQNADKLSVSEIKKQIADGKKRDLRTLKVGRLFIENKNTFLNRLYLRALLFAIYNFPQIYLSRGGSGIAVSSLLNHEKKGFDSRAFSYGSTGFAFCASSIVDGPENTRIMKIGVGYEHRAFGGDTMMRAISILSDILQTEDPDVLGMFS